MTNNSSSLTIIIIILFAIRTTNFMSTTIQVIYDDWLVKFVN